VEAPIGGITLIKGSSGVGKTTILQGITWCLYGNIRLVAPNHLEKAKTRVIIELPYNFNGENGVLIINRQKNPNRLILSHLEKVYEDKVAQSIIDDIFGNYDIWLASCYIGQGCRNSFLTAPNTGKMELLNSIAFHEEDPTSYIERIDSVITETDAEYRNKLALFTNNLNSFQTLLASTDISKALTPEQIANINSKIESLTKERSNLQIRKNQRDVNLGIMANLQRQLEQTNNTTITIPKADESLINLHLKYEGTLGGSYNIVEDIERNIALIMNIIPMLQQRDNLDSEVKRLDSLLLPYVNYKDTMIQFTQSDYQDALSKEIAFRDSQRLVQNLGVLYSENAIKELIQKHRDILGAQERLKLEKEYNILQNQLNILEMEHIQQMTPLKFPDITVQQIPVPDYSKYSTITLSEEVKDLSKKHGALQSHIQHLIKGRDVIQCPQCKGSLRYYNGSLVLAETGPSNLEELNIAQHELISIDSQINKINKSIQALTAAEAADRSSYEQAVIMEQKRIDSLRERVKYLELEKQRRDLANQARSLRIQEMKAQLQKISENMANYPNIDKIAEKRILSASEIEQTHALIGKLSSITILSPPKVSSQYIQSYLNYQELIQKQTVAVSAYREYIETIPTIFRNESIKNLQMYIEKLRIHWNRIRESAEERNRLDRLKISLQDQINKIMENIGVDPTSDIEHLNSEIMTHQQSLVLSTKAHQAIQYHAQITKEREEVINLNSTLGDLQTFRQHAVETECRILQQVVDSINASIEGVCGTLFDRDITIVMNLFKTLKTTKNVKPVANFTISYQGGTFDNINQMSGGEGDRASLALTLALKRLSSCPILMLDESLASLDLNMKEAAIRTIRENTNDTVLIIMHDGIEGHFSHVINVDEITQGRY
jgi:DNA repair exonuclease SbcCD ATPase subunit